MIRFRSAQKLNIRAGFSTASAKVALLVAGQEFWSDKQESRPGLQEWARVLDDAGNVAGWACIKDASTRYLNEVPQPALIADPLPPAPVAESLEQRIADLERDVALLLRVAGLKP